jgi:hypothetical protein
MMDRAWDFFMPLALGLRAVVFFGVMGFLVADVVSHADGPVVEKYYDDPDLVCGKGCIPVPECWTIVIDAAWWNDSACVSESEYQVIKIGDHFVE